MTDYKNVRYKLPAVTLSGVTEGSPAEGDIWYNSGKFNLGTSLALTGAWSSGGSLGIAKYGAAGAGTQSAGLEQRGLLVVLCQPPAITLRVVELKMLH